MALNFANVPKETPVDLAVNANPIPAGNLNIQNIAKDTPQATQGVTAVLMTEIARAGVQLSKFVLWIVTGSIVFLLGILILIERSGSTALQASYQEVFRQAAQLNDTVDTARLDKAVEYVKGAADAKKALTSEQATETRDIAAILSRSRIVPETSRLALDECASLPEALPANDRSAKLGNCIDVLSIARRASVAAGANVEKVRLLATLANDVNAHRQNTHSFWMQVAQMILLNLLLPLLTALFGYIFGTQQASHGNGG